MCSRNIIIYYITSLCLVFNSSYINRIAKDGGIYSPGVFYCKTAFDGLKVMNRLISPERPQFVGEWKQKLEKWDDKQQVAVEQSELAHSGIRPVPPPMAPHVNRPVRLEPSQIDLKEVWKYINKKSLFVLQWGMKGKGAKDQDPEKLFEEWTRCVIKEKLFEPRAVYGYYRCHNLTPGQGGIGRLGDAVRAVAAGGAHRPRPGRPAAGLSAPPPPARSRKGREAASRGS